VGQGEERELWLGLEGRDWGQEGKQEGPTWAALPLGGNGGKEGPCVVLDSRGTVWQSHTYGKGQTHVGAWNSCGQPNPAQDEAEMSWESLPIHHPHC
jgi:hypothetical protein